MKNNNYKSFTCEKKLILFGNYIVTNFLRTFRSPLLHALFSYERINLTDKPQQTKSLSFYLSLQSRRRTFEYPNSLDYCQPSHVIVSTSSTVYRRALIYRAAQRERALWSTCDAEKNWGEYNFEEKRRKMWFWVARFVWPFFSIFLVLEWFKWKNGESIYLA